MIIFSSLRAKRSNPEWLSNTASSFSGLLRCARNDGLWMAVLLISCFFSSPAAAQSPSIDPALCRALTKHTPDADVAYQPGVDVEGKPVVPADIQGTPPIKLPDKLTIPLNANLSKILNLNTSQYPTNALAPNTDIPLGVLTVEGNSVFYNGQYLSDDQQDNLAVLCLKNPN